VILRIAVTCFGLRIRNLCLVQLGLLFSLFTAGSETQRDAEDRSPLEKCYPETGTPSPTSGIASPSRHRTRRRPMSTNIRRAKPEDPATVMNLRTDAQLRGGRCVIIDGCR
jgi:hypothetical protein